MPPTWLRHWSLCCTFLVTLIVFAILVIDSGTVLMCKRRSSTNDVRVQLGQQMSHCLYASYVRMHLQLQVCVLQTQAIKHRTHNMLVLFR